MKYRVNYENTWEGYVEVEADSKEQAIDLAYKALSEDLEDLEDDEFDKVLYGPNEFPGDNEITNVEEIK